MGYRGSKTPPDHPIGMADPTHPPIIDGGMMGIGGGGGVKEQRVDGYSVLYIDFINTVRCTLVTGKPAQGISQVIPRLKLAQ